MGNLLESFKAAMPDKAVLLINEPTDLPEDSIGLIVADDKNCKDIEVAKRQVRVDNNIIDTKKHNYLAITKATPIRMRCVEAGGRLPRNHIPVASWDGENIYVSISMESNDILIEDIISGSLSNLIGEEVNREEYLALCKGLSIGMTTEKAKLETQESKNRKEGQNYLDKAKKYLEAADKNLRLIKNLEKIEKIESTKHAKEQWEQITEMIPTVLQKAWIEKDSINVITAPIILLGNFLGAYRIQVNISTGDLSIYGVTRGTNTIGNPHPHVRKKESTSTDSNVCWGTLVGTYTQLKSSKDYSQLIQAALRLLNQYNSESPYTTLDHWGRKYSGNIEDTTASDCRNRGPGDSLAQARKCLSCKTEECNIKNNNMHEIYQACHSLSSAKDCVSCEYTKCKFYHERFDRCWTVHQKTGPAFCMIRCTREECSHRETAKTICAENNRRADNTCPASGNCWNPCVKTGE